MKKRLLFVAALALTVVSGAFAQAQGDYVYTDTQRLKITGDNLVTNGDFSNAKEGWKSQTGEEPSAEVWDFASGAGMGPGGVNAVVSVANGVADAALCRAWTLDAGTYVVSYDIKGEAVTPTGIVNGNTCCVDFFLTTSDNLTKAAEGDVQVAGVNGFKPDWKTVRYFFTVDAGQKLVMHVEKLSVNAMMTNIKIFPATLVFDDRILQTKLDYVDKLIATGKFTKDTENGFITNVVGTIRPMLAEPGALDDPAAVADLMAAYDEELAKWYDLNAADLLKGEPRWSTYVDTRKMDGIGGNWKGTGGRWFHKNNGGSTEITNDGDEIGHRFQGGVEGNASQYYTIVPENPGTYMFSLDMVGHYMAGNSGKAYTYLSGTTDNYVTDWNRDFKGVTMYAGKDVMAGDAEANATMNIEQQGQKIDCGIISNPNAKLNPQKFVVFYEVSQEMVDAKTPVNFGITYILDPDRGFSTKLGSNVNIANPQIRLIGTTQELIDYQNEVKNIITQQGPFAERLQWAAEDMAKLAADGYPWYKDTLQVAIDKYTPVYNESLTVIDANGNVLNEAFIKEQMAAAAAGTGIAYSDSLLNSVRAMNSARSKFSRANEIVSTTYPQKVADAETVYNDAFYGAGDKATFRAAIDAAIAKRAEILGKTTDETREADIETLNAQLEVLAAAVEAFKASANNQPNVDIDFANQFVATEEGYKIEGAKGEMTFTNASPDANTGNTSYAKGFGEELLDVLRVGNGNGEVALPEAAQATDEQVLRFDFDMWYGNLSGCYAGVELQNAAGQRVAGFYLNRYNGVVDYNDFNNTLENGGTGLNLLKYVSGLGSSSVSNAGICVASNLSSFTLIVDYKAKAVQGNVVNAANGTCTGALIPMRTMIDETTPLEDNKIVKFVIKSNYSNADRRCWFDNLKIYKYNSTAEGPISGIQGLEAAKPAAQNGAIYNLAGQKVDKSFKGIVIVNGKKMVQK